MNKIYEYKWKDGKELLAILALADSVNWDITCAHTQTILETFKHLENYPHLVFLPEDYSIGGNYGSYIGINSKYIRIESYADMVAFLLNNPAKKKIVVQLNNEYSAKVTKDGIKVGCQLFPLSVVKDLVDAVKRIEEI